MFRQSFQTTLLALILTITPPFIGCTQTVKPEKPEINHKPKLEYVSNPDEYTFESQPIEDFEVPSMHEVRRADFNEDGYWDYYVTDLDGNTILYMGAPMGFYKSTCYVDPPESSY